MFFTASLTSGHLGGLLGKPEAAIFMKVGLPRALAFFPPTQIASLEFSGSLICIGGQGGKHAPQHMHFDSSISKEGLPFTIAGRIAATGQRATTVGRSHTLATRSWLMTGGLVCWTTMAMSAWPPQLISQQEVEMCTRLGISSRLNSSYRSSISALTTPDASVPGMSQCSQPCVCEIIDIELPVPPTGKPFFSSSAISGATFFSSHPIFSLFL